ncbi:epoxide hydrolase [Phyllobacterium sp. OV277]|uniref:epoxide hydrolase family protein n=1 Tax=Phyllobacterium sp. OV277 TaxID=1882772 RepID=UPI00087EE1C9|nr:epoxide hydrolase [Phyllobacterium sp. OV277]SDP29075.1 Pimeloyl-ACP methyl ester carboxylesterase [Phyllobacterium sp. OV277]
MPPLLPPTTRRSFLATSATALIVGATASGAFGLLPGQLASAAETTAIRPFQVNVPEADLVDLRKRVLATRWPAKETVNDQSQGVQLAKLKELIRYWGTDYDWRKVEKKLNALPMFVTEIDGLNIQFIHVRSKHPNALPVIITHGWPGSILELLKVIDPLTNPTAHSGSADDAFDVVIPSMPGYGFSDQPTETGWNADRIGLAWDVLMKRLGYKRYVSQGGDWGSVVSDKMARQAPEGLLGIHVNMPATVPADVAKAMSDGDPAPTGLTDVEKAAYESLSTFFSKNGAYGVMMTTRPQTVGYGLSDSPVGLAAWMYDKFAQWTYSGGDPEKSLTKDEMLDDITLYWLTNSAISSAQLYWENNANNFNAVDISIPAAVTVFPGEIYRAPRSWAEKSYHKLIYFNEVDKGGHFAAWEEPELFSAELRAAFRSLR